MKRFRTALNAGDPIPDPPFQKRNLDPYNSNADKEIFYGHANSQVVGTWIQNRITSQAFAMVLMKKKLFAFQDPTTRLLKFDGIVMLKIVLTALDPSVVVDVELLRWKLENMKLHPFKNDVTAMCTKIEDLMNHIEGLGQKCESIQRCTR